MLELLRSHEFPTDTGEVCVVKILSLRNRAEQFLSLTSMVAVPPKSFDGVALLLEVPLALDDVPLGLR